MRCGIPGAEACPCSLSKFQALLDVGACCLEIAPRVFNTGEAVQRYRQFVPGLDFTKNRERLLVTLNRFFVADQTAIGIAQTAKGEPF